MASLNSEQVTAILDRVGLANQAFDRQYPGDSMQRQPIHVVYGGAQLFRKDTTTRLGAIALKCLQEYAPDAASLAAILGVSLSETLTVVYQRIVEKLQREPVEDYRIDFEDGFGVRSAEEEAGLAVQSARALADAFRGGCLPPFVGIRIKPLSEEWKVRSVHTLDTFVSTLLTATAGQLPRQFVVTLPKVSVPEQVMGLVELLRLQEQRHSLAQGDLKLEIMVESPQALINQSGHLALSELLTAAQGRCVSVHFGPYDYLSLSGIVAASQSLTHPDCDFARQWMKLALRGTGVRLSDGPTSIMPIAPHRASDGGTLTPSQWAENQEAVHAAWRLSYRNIRHALEHGYYQGWDLHPAQLPIRYAACYLFFQEQFERSASRMRHFLDKAARATTLGNVFDDAATAQGLLNFFRQGLTCGAFNAQELSHAGLDAIQVEYRSFVQMLEKSHF
jgi:citrate lyase beta subunit